MMWSCLIRKVNNSPIYTRKCQKYEGSQRWRLFGSTADVNVYHFNRFETEVQLGISRNIVRT